MRRKDVIGGRGDFKNHAGRSPDFNRLARGMRKNSTRTARFQCGFRGKEPNEGIVFQ